MRTDVAIVGAGAAGVRAAVELDDRKATALLIEKEFYIGGKLTELSRMYPVCELYFAPKFFFQLYNSQNVEILTGSHIEAIKKENNIYKLTIRRSPRYVTDRCTLCLECVKMCEKNAIEKPPFQSVPQVMYIDREKCGDCSACALVCPENAIDLDQEEEIIEKETGAILYAAGAELFDAQKYGEYGYKRFPDVLTSIELEKMLHPSFETKGELIRPSDKKRPQKIAFLQCVGSRDSVKGEVYCSRICCMQALNEAKVVKERYPDTEVSIFFMDMQCPGKAWEQFYNNARKMDISCVRARVSSVYEDSGILYVTYAQDQFTEKEFDLVVLSVGISPNDAGDLEKNEFGFPISENVCGFFSHPADITESVQEALASIPHISGSVQNESELPEAGVQIFLCNCGRNDFQLLAEKLRNEGYPIYVADYLCTEKGSKEFLKTVKREKVVIAGCYLHEQLFKRLMQEKGFTPYIEVVNTRRATESQRYEKMVRMAVTKLEHLDTSKIQCVTVEVAPSVAVIGGGVAGLTAALELADTYQVFLIEKSVQLGGRASRIQFSPGYNPEEITENLKKKVTAHSGITVFTETEVTAVRGQCGNFLLKTNRNDIACGAIIVAVGANEYSHPYNHPKIVTQTELEEMIVSGDIPQLIVMIQCVGSRNDEYPWCSAVCCSKAVFCSLKILEKSLKSQVVILYRDMRTYGFTDALYRKAREKGVLFLQNDDMPEIEVNDDAVSVIYTDPILHARITIEPDLVVLSTGIVPHHENYSLGEKLGIMLDHNGFFRELHPKFYPVDSTREGIFLCGTCHSPQNVKETVIQAKAAVSRVRTVLCQPIKSTDKISVNQPACTGCAACVAVCPFGAISLVVRNGNPTASIDMSMCRDCGLCVGCCPVGALDQIMLSDEQLLKMVEVLYL